MNILERNKLIQQGFYRFVLALLFITLENCFTFFYEKRYEPIEEGDYRKEFVEGKKLVLGSFDSNEKEGKIQAQFLSILIGRERVLNIAVDSKAKTGNIFETNERSNQKQKAILLYDSNFGWNQIFNDKERLVSFQKLEVNPDDLPNTFPVFGLTHEIYYVELEKTEEGLFRKKFVPEKYYYNGKEIGWVQRNRIRYIFLYSAFYAGYIVTIPLDIITFPIQAIFYLSSGGVK